MEIRQEENKKMIISIVATLVVVIGLVAIFDSWNSMWYHCGENVYHMLNK